VAGGKDRAERAHVAALERSDRLTHALVLGLDVTDAARVARFELTAPVAVRGVLERVPLAGVKDEQRQLLRQRHPAVLERAAVQ
jgi:hypothetical protein